MQSYRYILTMLIIITGLLYFYSTMNPYPSKSMTELDTARLVKNMDNYATLPLNFRFMTDEYNPEMLLKNSSTPPRLGLDELKASGSAQFSELALKEIIKAIPPCHQLTIVDLRQESHGFIDGTAVSWYGNHNWLNRYKSSSVIELEQAQLLKGVIQQKCVSIYSDKYVKSPYLLPVKYSWSENELAKGLGIDYRRFYVTDHVGPVDTTVDEFITFIKQLSANTWLHFHCAKGRGRTTTFLTMYDMLHNSHQVSFKDIMVRQQLIGGADLEIMSAGTYKEQEREKRYLFLQRFYEYCRANPQLEQTWSSWLEQQ